MNSSMDWLARVEALEARLQRAEDELAIRNLIARYGLAADCGDSATAMACHHPQAVYCVSAPRAGREDTGEADRDLELQGREAIGAMLESPLHRSLLPGCAHTVGPLTVEIDGDRARVTGYSRLYHQLQERPELMRLGINEWQLARSGQGWWIVRRESRLLGEEAAQVLLRRAAYTPSGDL